MSYDENHFVQLTAEEAKTSYSKGRKIRYYALRPGRKRNEALDIFGYSLAALEGLKLSGLDLRRRWEKMLARQEYAEKVREAVEANPEVNVEDIPKPKILQKRKRRRVVARFA